MPRDPRLASAAATTRLAEKALLEAREVMKRSALAIDRMRAARAARARLRVS
jgi:hypothetical protein